MHDKHETTLGPAKLGFADEAEVDTFIHTLARFERGEMSADEWRAFRLVSGTYGQRQAGQASMLRVKVPQGVLDAAQLEVLASVAERYSRGFCHITTRQNIQLHFLPLAHVAEAMRELAAVGLTTREACGNSVRNVTTSATAGVARDEVFDATPYAEAFTRYFLRHPLSASLPRKFKVAFSGGGADHAFAIVNDIGFHARLDAHGRRAFRVTVGGGTAILCATGRELFPLLPAGEILAVAEAIVRVFFARGDREHRHKNRMKFLIKQMGYEVWREAVLTELQRVEGEGAPRLAFEADAPEDRATPPRSRDRAPTQAELSAFIAQDTMRGPGIVPRFLPVAGDPRGERFVRSNVLPQRQDGYAIVTVVAPLGDLSSGRLRALASLARSYADATVRTTHAQNLVLRWVPTTQVHALYTDLTRIGLAEPDADSGADVSSCPGAESCKLAVTQSRGVADLVGSMFREERALVDRAAGLVVKASGCPNGCGLHHVAGIGLQGGLRKVGGRAAPQYFLYVGGDPSGENAHFGRVAAKLPARRVPEAIRRVIALYEAKRGGGESITAYLGRVALPEVRAALADLEKLDDTNATAEDFVDLAESERFRPETSEGECAS